MKAKITRENLQYGVRAADEVAMHGRVTLPILQNVLIEATGESIRFSATDLDHAVSLKVPAEVSEEGMVTVSARKLREIAKELPEHPIKLQTKGAVLTLACGRSRFELHTMPADEVPGFPIVTFSGASTIRGQALAALIASTAFCASSEEARPILNGVHWQIRANLLRMCATNGHRLAVAEMLVEGGIERTGEVVVPPKALEMARRLFGPETDVEVAFSGNHLGFRTPGIELYSRLIEGPYPNYDKVIPQDPPFEAVIRRHLLMGALKRISLLAGSNHRVEFNFSKANHVTLGAEAPDQGRASEEVEVVYTGSRGCRIGFDSKYLLSVLEHCQTDEVRIALTAPERAATLTPVWDDVDHSVELLYLIMPLRLLDGEPTNAIPVDEPAPAAAVAEAAD